MEVKEKQDDHVLIFDTTNSINHLTGNEFYFFSNHDAKEHKKKYSQNSPPKETYQTNNVTDLSVNINKKNNTVENSKKKNDKYGKREKEIINKNKKDNQDKETKLYVLNETCNLNVHDYLFSKCMDKKRTYEEREKFVFEQEYAKVTNIYDVDEVLKIINNLNSIRKEIETVIYKKLEKRYKDYLINSVKIREIENHISNINDLVVDNMNELKVIQDNKYKEILNIIELVKKKKKNQKINSVILIIYIISIFDKIIFRTILKKNYEYASLVYHEMSNLINDNIKLLKNINCIRVLKEKMSSEYLNRLKQKNQTNFIEFLFSNNSKKNLEIQIQVSFKIYYLIYKSKSSNFIENLLGYVYQCFRKISKQVILSFVIIQNKKNAFKTILSQNEEEKKRTRNRDMEKREISNEELKEEIMFLNDKSIKTADSELKNIPISENTNKIILMERASKEDIHKINKNSSDTELKYIDALKNMKTFKNVHNNNDTQNARTDKYEINKQRKTLHSSETISTNNVFENEINQKEDEDNLLFIPLNELVHKLNEKDRYISMVKVYEITFDILNKYDFIIIFLLSCYKNYASKLINNNESDNKMNLDENKEKVIPINYENPSTQNSIKIYHDINSIKCNDHKYNNCEMLHDKTTYDHKIQKEKTGRDKKDNTDDLRFNFYDILNFHKNKKHNSICSQFSKNINSYISTSYIMFMNNNDECNNRNNNYSFLDKYSNIKDQIENYLMDKMTKYEYCEEYANFSRKCANKFINSKKKFLKNIEKVIKTIVENIQFDNFDFNYVLGFIVITIIFCIHSFLFENDCSNKCIYNLRKYELNSTHPKHHEHTKNHNSNEETCGLNDTNTILNNSITNKNEKEENKNLKNTLKEYFLNEFPRINIFEKENIDIFYSMIESNIIFKEIEKNIKNNFSKILSMNIRKLNNAINNDTWVRIPTIRNQSILKKKNKFSSVISFYKKIFNNFLNIPFSENPLMNFNFETLEEDLSSYNILNDPLEGEINYISYSENNITNQVSFGKPSDNITLEKRNTYQPSDTNIWEQTIEKKSEQNKVDNNEEEKKENLHNLTNDKNKIYSMKNFEIVNFDIVSSYSTNMLISVLQKYLELNELLPSLKDEIHNNIFKTIDLYIYMLCYYFMKKETIDELIVDPKHCNERIGLNSIYFIIKRQEKYKELYTFLTYYNDEIKNEQNICNLKNLNINKSNFPKPQCNVDNFNRNNIADNKKYLFRLNNYSKIYSSTSTYAISEKIVSIESLYCLISKLKEDIIKIYVSINEENNNYQNSVITEKKVNDTCDNYEHIKEENSNCKPISKDKNNIFISFLNDKLKIVEELRILIYCDSLFGIIDSSNYIKEVLKIINDSYNNEKEKKKKTNDDLNLKNKNFKMNLNEYMNLYLNILNDGKRKLMFSCEGVTSIIIHYLLWNLINYIFNLNNIEIIYNIKKEIIPIISSSKNIKNQASNSNYKSQENNKYMSTAKNGNTLLSHNNYYKRIVAPLNNKHGKTEIFTTHSNQYEDNYTPELFIINTLKYFFSTISNSIIQNIKYFEKEIENYLNKNNNATIQNTIYMKFYNDLKNSANNSRHNFYYIYLSNEVKYYDQYLDLHFYNLEKLDYLIKNCNPDFFQYKHILSIIMKYHHFKMIPDNYVASYEMGIIKCIQNKIKSVNS
ncbi:conserved Plasmodium protein, unknown function [Plasmodium berghei]|uniref:Uncharacterized protein n=2 Tax=Plasmodium berghei TaxID=5821 RepID=A0A509AN63_PLABA|nr:conserved Plasmodium protein, unknown function [Plasmodium berghei ANKA]SCM20612.1 conserved Plasmodium protein, unknown function [Plasmodium berghei]SCN24221.1 conserved Plasmodium protein, unknown function [Plasmodium berghei]SCO60675.1 conserved Plasmodium protein, unknown function [Plasmodium berghei]VUC55164.1 conserved Plasmodium protein, unknown function [Plasmodium berghei ANKA]|eukprot:XP_034420977.1 conserved Plasmodium protein, unknown function [Plasmodium berghei ANKA]